MSCGIAVMAKASALGRTKTRLVPPLSFEEASALNTTFLQDVSANLLRARADGGDFDAYMAYGPPGTARFFEEHLPSEIGRFESWFPDFGVCLLDAIRRLFDLGHDHACVLNVDSPTLPRSIIREAVDVLETPGDRMVIGASDDGGYYLLGLKSTYKRLFEDVSWSTGHVFQQTLERAAEIGLAVHRLPVWYDVDDWASLMRLSREVFEARSFSNALQSSPAIASKAFLNDTFTHHDLAARLQDCVELALTKASG